MEEKQNTALEEARKKKLLEIKIRQILQQIVDGNAYERLMNIKIANEDLYTQLVQLLIYLYQNGQIKKKISETELKNLVSRILSKRRESGSIRFVRK